MSKTKIIEISYSNELGEFWNNGDKSGVVSINKGIKIRVKMHTLVNLHSNPDT